MAEIPDGQMRQTLTPGFLNWWIFVRAVVLQLRWKRREIYRAAEEERRTAMYRPHRILQRRGRRNVDIGSATSKLESRILQACAVNSPDIASQPCFIPARCSSSKLPGFLAIWKRSQRYWIAPGRAGLVLRSHHGVYRCWIKFDPSRPLFVLNLNLGQVVGSPTPTSIGVHFCPSRTPARQALLSGFVPLMILVRSD